MPVPMRHGINNTPTAQSASSQTCHVRSRSRLIDKHDPSQVNLRVFSNPRFTTLLDIGAFSFAGPQRFFYTDTPIASAHCG